MISKGSIIAIAVAIGILYASFVHAQIVTPEGPDQINITYSFRGAENGTAVAVQAVAGNVTHLKIHNNRLTQAWAGYYGNITGSIVLDDASNTHFYQWDLADPQGEVYAANSSNSPQWTSVFCLNVSQNEGWGQNETNVTLPLRRPDGAVSDVNTSRIEIHYGINQSDLDGLNETFWYEPYGGAGVSTTTSFVVAGKTIDSTDGCSVGHPNRNNATSIEWDEVILSDNDTLIFTSIIRTNAIDYRNHTSDFQMLVLENGHTEQAASITTYYFYVELS